MIAQNGQQVILRGEAQFHDEARQVSALLLLQLENSLHLSGRDDPALDQSLLQAEVVFHFLLIPPFDCFYDSKFQRAGETVVNVKLPLPLPYTITNKRLDEALDPDPTFAYSPL